MRLYLITTLMRMNELNEKTYRFTLLVVTIIGFISLLGNIFLEYRLGRTRQQLNDIRMELVAAQNRQYEIADVLRRDSEILSESFSTVEGIRSQIRCIRESYEEMEKLLYSSGAFNLSNNSNNNSAFNEE